MLGYYLIYRLWIRVLLSLGWQVSSDESQKLIKMEEVLHQRVIGQEEAVVAISRAIRRARVGKPPAHPP